MSKIQVVILAGGFGTRLSEETTKIPKPLVKVGKYPIILHLMWHYAFYGFKDFIICLGYKGDLIVNYFKKNKHNYLNIKFVKTGLKSLTGERLKRVQKYVSETFFLTYGDGLSDVDILKSYKFYQKNKKIGLVTAINPVERYGILKLKKNNTVYDFSEKPKNSTHWINGGFFIFNKQFFISKFIIISIILSILVVGSHPMFFNLVISEIKCDKSILRLRESSISTISS